MRDIPPGLERFASLSSTGITSVHRLRLAKLRALLRTPRYWRPFLQHRVLPTAEFEGLPFAIGIKTVLDVGANRGQFGLFASHQFPTARIHMFEPVTSAARTARQAVPSGTLFECALGDSDGELEFFVHPDSDQSSALPLAGATRTRVLVRRLDAMNIELRRPVLLKLDVQGFEIPALHGGAGIMNQIDQVLCEVSSDGYVVGGPTASEVVTELAHFGFLPIAAGPILPYGTDLLFGRDTR